MIKIEYIKSHLECLYARRFSDKDLSRFRCNICGKAPLSPVSELTDREKPSCYFCGSNLRFRSIVAALSIELFGLIIPIPDMSESREIVGIGISDSRAYSGPLAGKFSYTNTFFHKRPRLDIMEINEELRGSADFVISSEVFEHVPPPVDTAFANLFALLKPKGICVLTVPYVNEGQTREHFPDLYRYRIIKKGGSRVLINRTREGEEQVFEDLRFHGGKGSTLEMRLFSKESLLENIRKAGFCNITIHQDSFPEFGIYLDGINSSFTISMRRA
ncbi:MAG: methyltransferase domain-containing protein [Acidobacteriota bacterium]